MKPLFFTADDLAKRWGVTPEQVLQYGAEGLLQFGVYVDGFLMVEIGKSSPYPEMEFAKEASGPWSGFIPVKKSMVARCWLHGGTEIIEIPDTDCGKEVRVLDYIPYPHPPGGEQSFRLLVSADDLDKFEQRNGLCSPIDENACDNESEAPQAWNVGMRRVAWEVARKFWEKNGRVSWSPLFDEMMTRTDVNIVDKGDKKELQYCGSEFGAFKSETVLESTVKNDWASQLNKLFKQPA
jgi:hypothetical protein